MSITQQVQPTNPNGVGDGAPIEDAGNTPNGSQTSFQRVSPEEAATLPYDELKRRMREEARLVEAGELDATRPVVQEDDGDDDGDELGTAGRDEDSSQGSGGAGGGGTTQQPQDSELQNLLRQAQDRAATLERERAQEREANQRAQLQAQHQRVEQAIAALPETQQSLARQDYMNRLGAQALNDYHGFLQQREQAVRNAELVQARRQLPDLLSELADSVAQRHGLRNADPLKSYVKSAEFRQLLEASNTEDALTAAAANAGQWMEYLAQQQATQNATLREQRRKNAPRTVRDTPNGGVPPAGGDMDAVRRINTMSKDEFFAWKKQQLREAATR